MWVYVGMTWPWGSNQVAHQQANRKQHCPLFRVIELPVADGRFLEDMPRVLCQVMQRSLQLLAQADFVREGFQGFRRV